MGCFGFDEQEVHMHSTKNVNETHSSQFLMETSLDLGIRRWGEMRSPSLSSKKTRKREKEKDAGGNYSFEEKGKEDCMG